MKKITIAIDGFSSCGKSTMAKELARKVGYIYVDSGAMYRAVTLFAIRSHCFLDGQILADKLHTLIDDVNITFRIDDKTGAPHTYLNGENVETCIRTMEVSSKVSVIASLPFVRTAMVSQQQAFGREKGVVMDGRDIGTVVFPDAELKIFVTASAEVRAQRRFDELTAKGISASMEEILDNVKSRDHMDQHREISPLVRASDAILLDNTQMSLAEQDAWLMEHFKRALHGTH